MYYCKNCKEEWEFFPEDYDSPEDYPTICPLCSMPISQMIKDIWDMEGLSGVLKMLFKRYF